jgi:hypothetical protein
MQRLTFGAFGAILRLNYGTNESSFWLPIIASNLGFGTADRKNKRFFHYLEVLRHRDDAAWDIRSIPTRVQADIRRDFVRALSDPSVGAKIHFGRNQWVEHFYDRLSNLQIAISQYEELLREKSLAEEEVFHTFLVENPIFLDVYAQESISKPRFVYPKGESPLGKRYIEPDFILKYSGNSYRLVELERPSKSIATKQGQPRAEMTQPAFQIAEWKAFIRNHYDLLKQEFPGISSNFSTAIIMSRSTPESFGTDRDILKYKELLREQFAVDEILTYDDVLERAKQAYIALTSLGARAANSA